MDGPHHFLSTYRFYDSYRDAIANDENFEIIRYSFGTIQWRETKITKIKVQVKMDIMLDIKIDMNIDMMSMLKPY